MRGIRGGSEIDESDPCGIRVQSHVWDPYGILIGSDMRPLGSSSVPNRFLAGSSSVPT